MSRSAQIAISVFTAGVVVALLMATPIADHAYRIGRQTYGFAVWDLWHRSAVRWRGSVIVLPSGKYGWSEESPRRLVLFGRTSDRSGVLTIRADADAKQHVADVTIICAAVKCKNSSESKVNIAGTNVYIAQYVTDSNVQNVEAVLKSEDGRFAISVHSAKESADENIALAQEVMKQLLDAAGPSGARAGGK